MNETEGKVIKRGTDTGTMEDLLTTEKGKIYFETRNGYIKIINDDFLTTNLIGENLIDLIVTSPPYNVDIHYNSFQDDIPYEKYLEFTEKWLIKAYSLMKSDGRMCLKSKMSLKILNILRNDQKVRVIKNIELGLV